MGGKGGKEAAPSWSLDAEVADVFVVIGSAAQSVDVIGDLSVWNAYSDSCAVCLEGLALKRLPGSFAGCIGLGDEAESIDREISATKSCSLGEWYKCLSPLRPGTAIPVVLIFGGNPSFASFVS